MSCCVLLEYTNELSRYLISLCTKEGQVKSTMGYHSSPTKIALKPNKTKFGNQFEGVEH